MDTVATLTLSDFSNKNANIGLSAADLFKNSLGTTQTDDSTQNQDTTLEKTDKTALQLFNEASSTKTEEEIKKEEEEKLALIEKEKENAGKTPEEIEAAKVADAAKALETKAAGRPTEKISDQTKADILAMIEDGVLEGFTDAKYETKKDLQELLTANKEKWREEIQTTAKEDLIASLKPGEQFVLEYAKYTNHPVELIPFLTAMDNYNYSQELNPEEPEHQEEIIRQINALKGFSEAASAKDIKFLKDSNQLAERAKELKPSLDQYNAQVILEMKKEKEDEEKQQQIDYENHRKAVKAAIVDVPQIDGLKFKAEHKDLAYRALSQRGKTGDLLIYSMIDDLVTRGDLATLAEMVILGTDKKAYRNYVGATQKVEDATTTMRVLKSRENTNNTSISDNQNDADTKKGLQRPANNSLGSFPRK